MDVNFCINCNYTSHNPTKKLFNQFKGFDNVFNVLILYLHSICTIKKGTIIIIPFLKILN